MLAAWRQQVQQAAWPRWQGREAGLPPQFLAPDEAGEQFFSALAEGATLASEARADSAVSRPARSAGPARKAMLPDGLGQASSPPLRLAESAEVEPAPSGAAPFGMELTGQSPPLAPARAAWTEEWRAEWTAMARQMRRQSLYAIPPQPLLFSVELLSVHLPAWTHATSRFSAWTHFRSSRGRRRFCHYGESGRARARLRPLQASLSGSSSR
jgi:hypothetical protein